MRIEVDGRRIQVFLSRRNLETLLAKLDGHPPDSACSIEAPDIYVPTRVTAEEDDVHYSHPDRKGVGPGVMVPETEVELFVRSWEQKKKGK